MSHVVDGMVEIKDLEVLEEVCKKLGLVFKKGQKYYRWYGRWMNDYHEQDAACHRFDPSTFGTCEHAIEVPGAQYDIGIARDRQGKLRFVYDAWLGGCGIEEKLGKGAKLLVQSYAEEVCKKQLRRQGYQVSRQVTSDGKVVLRAVKA